MHINKSWMEHGVDIMIPLEAIDDWSMKAPWGSKEFIEQDLLISRILVELYSVPQIAEKIVFMGGTALHKLHIDPSARYSEDMDFRMTSPGGVRDLLDTIDDVVFPLLGKPKRRDEDGKIVRLKYKVKHTNNKKSTGQLKIEINTSSRLPEFGYQKIPFGFDNLWYSGQADIKTLTVEEILGDKLSALYGRDKWRDLYDIWYAVDRCIVHPKLIVQCFQKKMKEENNEVIWSQFDKRMRERLEKFRTSGLYRERNDPGNWLRDRREWNHGKAIEFVSDVVISLLPKQREDHEEGMGRIAKAID